MFKWNKTKQIEQKKMIESPVEDYPSDESFDDGSSLIDEYTTESNQTMSISYDSYLATDVPLYNTQIPNDAISNHIRNSSHPPQLPSRIRRLGNDNVVLREKGRPSLQEPSAIVQKTPNIIRAESCYEDPDSSDSENISKYQCPYNHRRLPLQKLHSTETNEWNDTLFYEINLEHQKDDMVKPPTPPPPRTNAAALKGNHLQEVPSELIQPQKPTCHPAFPQINFEKIIKAKNDLKSTAQEDKSKNHSVPPHTEISKVALRPVTSAKHLSVNINNTPKKTPVLPPIPPPSKKPNDSLERKKWFQDINREQAASTLEAIRKNGAFIVRPSNKQRDQPYTLVIYLDGNILNIPLRKRSDSKFALGSSKQNELAFDSICGVIAYHSRQTIEVTTEKGIREVTLVDINK